MKAVYAGTNVLRPIRAPVALFLVGVAPLSCTSLLGSFEVSGESANGDGGGALESGAETSSDGGSDAAVDAGPDAPDDYAMLNCQESGSSRRKLTTFAKGTGQGEGPDRVIFGAFKQPGGATSGVAVLPDGAGQTHVIVFPLQGGGSVQTLPVPSLSGGGTTGSYTRLVAAKRFKNGTAVVVEQQTNLTDGGARPALVLYRLQDGGATWVGPELLTQEGDLGAAGTCQQRLLATFEPRDEQAADISLVITYQEGTPGAGNTCTITTPPKLKAKRHRVGGVGQTFQEWPVPAGVTGFDLNRDSIAIAPNNHFILIGPAGGGGPVQGQSAFVYRSNPGLGYEDRFTLPLKAPTNALMGFGLQAYAETGIIPDTIGALVLEANLQSASAKPTYYVGSAPITTTFSINPSAALTPTVIDAISELPVDKASTHIDHFGQSTEFFAIGRAMPTQKGFNMLWWDKKGRLRGRASGNQPGGAILKPNGAGVSLAGDILFGDTPGIVFATMHAVWVENPDVNDVAKPYEVWAAEISCIK